MAVLSVLPPYRAWPSRSVAALLGPSKLWNSNENTNFYSKIGAYTWPPPVILSPSLLPVSTCRAQRAVWRSDVSRSRCVAVEGVAALLGRRTSPSRPRPLSRARHLPRSLLRLAFVSFSSLSSPWMASEQLAFIDRIRELRSMDFKSTATKARQPS